MAAVGRLAPLPSPWLTAVAGVFAVTVTFVFASGGGGSAVARAAPITPVCAATADRPATPVSGTPCWVDVSPYPFGSDGDPVDTSTARCGLQQGECYLAATSFAFRSWNRGLAATAPPAGVGKTPFGVWLWNGARWYPDPTFPGSSVCQGNTVLWAGKLDYWLIGPGPQNWPSLCRFDGVNFFWQPLALPKATIARVTPPPTPANPTPSPNPGGITSGSCLSWDNCWFFGTYGTVVHWNGSALSDASPPLTKPWLGGEYNAAALRTDPSGASFGFAVASTAGRGVTDPPLPAQPSGSPPPELQAYTGAGWTPTSYAPPTIQAPGDPYRTDLIALDLTSSGGGWIVGVPAGRRATAFAAQSPGRVAATQPEPAPLIPIAPQGPTTPCQGPAPDRFVYSNDVGAESVLWSTISVFPGSGAAIAGGAMRPGVAPGGDVANEPLLAQVSCSGDATLTRFRIPDPSGTTLVPADRLGTVRAVAANAVNDAWAATSPGQLPPPPGSPAVTTQPPHLYRLTNGMPPQAPAGNDFETRPILVQQDAPVIVIQPLPPESPPASTNTTTAENVVLPPAVFNVTVKLNKKLVLAVKFNVRRTIVLGLEAVRNHKQVGRTGLKTFQPSVGSLQLKLNRKRWPKRLVFLTDAPKVRLQEPGFVLSGVVNLQAVASAIKGRVVKSVAYEYVPEFGTAWQIIGTAKSSPYTVPFDTTKVPDGAYDLRAVVTDSTGKSAFSGELPGRTIMNGGG